MHIRAANKQARHHHPIRKFSDLTLFSERCGEDDDFAAAFRRAIRSAQSASVKLDHVATVNKALLEQVHQPLSEDAIMDLLDTVRVETCDCTMDMKRVLDRFSTVNDKLHELILQFQKDDARGGGSWDLLRPLFEWLSFRTSEPSRASECIECAQTLAQQVRDVCEAWGYLVNVCLLLSRLLVDPARGVRMDMLDEVDELVDFFDALQQCASDFAHHRQLNVPIQRKRSLTLLKIS